MNSLRLDHAVATSTLAFLRYTRSNSDSRTGYLQLNESVFRSSAVTVGLLNAFGARITNDLRLNVSGTSVESSWQELAYGGAQPLDLATILPQLPATGRHIYGLSIGGFPQFLQADPGRSRQAQWNLVDTLALNAATHQLRFGVDYQRLNPERETPIHGVVGLFPSLSELRAGIAPTLNFLEAASGESVIETFSLFAQDTWQVNSRFNVTYGARWELTPPPSYRGFEATSLGVNVLPVATPGAFPLLPGVAAVPVWKTRYSQIAPRAGVAYRLDSDGSLLLRAGTGLFYDLGFNAVTDILNGMPFNRWVVPLATALPAAREGTSIYGFASDLVLPRSWHWNVSLEKLFAHETVIGASYVGASGSRLLRLETSPVQPGTPQLILATNHGASRYHALQLQLRRSIARSLRGFANYSWGHSIDNGSWDSATFVLIPGASDRGSSDFDARHSFHSGLTLDVPSAWARDWTVSGVFRARSAFPVDIVAVDNPFGLSWDNARPDLVAGVPVWLSDSNVPAGRRLNPAAFVLPPRDRQGTLGRNAIRGFGLAQVDLSLQRRFALTERISAAIRLEAYNISNHVNFGDPVRFLGNPLFGQSLSQTNLFLGTGRAQSGLTPALQPGGPRSLQVRIDLRF
jgi:hypothetical protein